MRLLKNKFVLSALFWVVAGLAIFILGEKYFHNSLHHHHDEASHQQCPVYLIQIEYILEHTVTMIPFLLGAYVLVGFLEYRYKDRLGIFIMKLGILGPVMGAIAGCVPQCGFSVVASTLYVKRLISTGTLLAVYLSTSDEALPVLLSMPWQEHTAFILIAIKVTIAVIAGICVDVFINHQINKEKLKNARSVEASYHEAVDHHHGCCAHDVGQEHSAFKALILHPIWHTIKIFLFLFVLTVVLTFGLEAMGEDKLKLFFLHGTIFQPVVAALVGLIPNCLSSVALVKLFDQEILDFGSLVAGLSSAAGLGLPVLIKENKDLKNTFFIIALLLGISILVGVFIQYVKIQI